MAITGPTLVAGTWYNTANTNPYSTVSGTNTFNTVLTAGRRYFFVIEAFSSGAAENITSVVHSPSGTPTNFSRVTDGTTDAQLTGFGVTGNVFEVWQVNVTATTADDEIVITFGGTQSACGGALYYIEGEDDTGTIVQVVKATGTSTSPAVTMASFGATDNLLLLAVCRDDIAGGFTVTESRTELYENQESERNWSTTHYQNPHGGDTSVGCTLNVSDDWAAIGIEVKAAVSAGIATVSQALMAGPAAWTA